MKKIIIKLAILATLVSSSSAIESLHIYKGTSLVGIEGTYNLVDVSNDASYSDELAHLATGIKIGAQTDEYRLFFKC